MTEPSLYPASSSSSPSAGARWDLGRWLLTRDNPYLVWAVVIVVCHVVGVLLVHDIQKNDFAVFHYSGALSLRLEGNPYTLLPEAQEYTAERYPYPPFLAYLCYPLSWFGASTATYCWFALDFLLTGVLAWQITAVIFPNAISGWKRARVVLLVLAIILCLPPQIAGNKFGQVHNLIAVSVLGTYLALRSGKDAAAGLFLAFGILVKVFPAVLIAAMLCSGRIRAVLVTVAVCLLFSLVTWPHSRQYVTDRVVGNAAPSGLANETYVSLPAMAERLFSGRPEESRLQVDSVPIVESKTLRNLALVAAGALVLIPLIRVVTLRPLLEIAFSTFLVSGMLLTPAFGYYHLNLAVIAAVILLRAIKEAGTQTIASTHWPRVSRLLCLVAVAIALIAIPLNFLLDSGMRSPWLRAIHDFTHSGWGLLLLTPQTYGLLLLFYICLRCTQLLDRRPSAV